MGWDISTDADANGGKVIAVGSKAAANGELLRFDELKQAPGVLGDVAGYDAGGRIQSNDPVDALDAANKQWVEAQTPPVSYDGVDVTQAYANGQILGQGFIPPSQHGFRSNAGSGNLAVQAVGSIGVRGTPHDTIAGYVTYHYLPFVSTWATSIIAYPHLIKGTRTSIKGRYVDIDDAVTLASAERFFIGWSRTTTSGANIGPMGEAETTRDDTATVGVNVDDLGNIQSFNTADNGDASYTDSGFDADVGTGIYWEIIVEVPQAANSVDDLLITIKVNGNTILNAVAPAGTNVVSNGQFGLILLGMNSLHAYASDIVMKVEKVA